MVPGRVDLILFLMIVMSLGHPSQKKMCAFYSSNLTFCNIKKKYYKSNTLWPLRLTCCMWQKTTTYPPPPNSGWDKKAYFSLLYRSRWSGLAPYMAHSGCCSIILTMRHPLHWATAHKKGKRQGQGEAYLLHCRTPSAG